MKIVYVGKHGTGGNDDEGAIDHALRRMGHDVELVDECRNPSAHRFAGDLLLFHKWSDTRELARVPIPKVFWYFDLVETRDAPDLQGRNRSRSTWMSNVLPLVDIGFCTDGDWAAKHLDNLVWLTQGADERLAFQSEYEGGIPTDILFTGASRRCGTKRLKFVQDMIGAWGGLFHHVPSGLHREALASTISQARIVVAPDFPVTDLYWSNRVYLTLGFGGFLLHPYCDKLADHYEDGEEIVFYHTRHELHDLIDHYWDRHAERQAIASAAKRRTQREHLYRHRCEKLIQTVQERLL